MWFLMEILLLHNFSQSSPVIPLNLIGSSTPPEYLELNLDYWTASPKPDPSEKDKKESKKETNKFSLKSAFKSILIQRQLHGATGDLTNSPLSMTVVAKEKKQKSKCASLIR